jgi:hypothetical protein
LYNIEELAGYAFYYLLFFIIVFLGTCRFVNWINNKQLINIVAIILIFIAGFRGLGIDKDYATYLNSFSLVKEPFDYIQNYQFWAYLEPFYYFFPSIVKTIELPFSNVFLFVLFAFLGVYFKLTGISKLSNHVGISLVAYFAFYFFLHEMTQIRVGIASGGLLLCAYYYYHKNWSLFFLFLIGSMCFQYTGILILLLFVLNTKKFNLAINLTLLIAAYTCVLLRINVIDGFIFKFNLPFTEKLLLTLKTLTFNENLLNPFNIPYLLNFILTIWLFINYKKIQINTQYGILLLKIQLLSFICFGIFSSVAVVAFRLYEFFGVASIITVTYFIYTIKNKYIANATIIAYSLLLLINMLHITKLMFPYSFIFFEN